MSYTVRRDNWSGHVLGTYRHPGPDEPSVGTILIPSDGDGIQGGPWRVIDYVKTNVANGLNNTLVVEELP